MKINRMKYSEIKKHILALCENGEAKWNYELHRYECQSRWGRELISRFEELRATTRQGGQA